MSRRARVTEADMRRAIKAARECGLSIRECIVSADGVRLLFGLPAGGADIDTGDAPAQVGQPIPWPRMDE